MNVPTPTPVVGPALVDYFMSHVETPRSFRVGGFFTLARDMPAFKKVMHPDRFDRYGIANLIIPQGTVVYAQAALQEAGVDYYASSVGRKMRAERAFVHSVWSLSGSTELRAGRSYYDTGFCYVPDAIVVPTRKFSRHRDACDSGIHFFLNLADAKNYLF